MHWQNSNCMLAQKWHTKSPSTGYVKSNGLIGGVRSMIGPEAAAGGSRTVSSTVNSSNVYMLWCGCGCLRKRLGYGGVCEDGRGSEEDNEGCKTVWSENTNNGEKSVGGEEELPRQKRA